jgi:hypothetical protein
MLSFQCFHTFGGFPHIRRQSRFFPHFAATLDGGKAEKAKDGLCRVGWIRAQFPLFLRRLPVSVRHVDVRGETGREPQGSPAGSPYFVSVPKWK